MPSELPALNSALADLDPYASKHISARAKSDRDIVNFAIGEPFFGPPEYLRPRIEETVLTYASFSRSVKSYEVSLGSLELREAIAKFYERRYAIAVDPEREILITHGGAEAIALAILCTSTTGEAIVVTDPTYMLYGRVARSLQRTTLIAPRNVGTEYLGLFRESASALADARAIIVNSPENPTGYVIDDAEWAHLSREANRYNLWVIHDEVYDTMSFGRPHRPARGVDGLGDRSILINSLSKKFGAPGLRIGWLCAPARLIAMAAKLHDYLYLGVNSLSEAVAAVWLEDPQIDGWLAHNTALLSRRAEQVVRRLDTAHGYEWSRSPLGGMFAFPDVTALAARLPRTEMPDGDNVARHLLEKSKVAVVPGSVYGRQGAGSLRIVLCTTEPAFQAGLERLASVPLPEARRISKGGVPA